MTCRRLGFAALFGLTTLSPSHAQGVEFEVIHRWTSAGESAALQIVADAFEKSGNVWIDTAIADDAEMLAVSRVVGGDPPAAFQFNTGTDMDELVNAGLLRNFDALAKAQDWQGALPEFVWDAITRDGSVYAVPVNLQSEVWIWYSKQVFETAGVTPPATYDDLFAALDKIAAAGFVPLAMGGQPWQEQILFDKILVGLGGADYYTALYGGDFDQALNAPEFDAVADTFARLRQYVDVGSTGRSWSVAANMVVTDRAGIHIMGDWAKAEFTSAGMEPVTDFGCVLGPGDTTLLVSGDVFTMPKIDDPGIIQAQDTLAELLMSKAVQVDFNNIKGSFPARLDVDYSKMDGCAQTAIETAQQPGKLLPGAYFFLSSDTRGGLQEVIAQFWNDPDQTADDLRDAMREVFETTG